MKKYVTTFENIENTAAGGSVHTLNPATWLSCVRPDTAAKGASMSITLDQVIAQKLGQKTALPSLEVCLGNHHSGGRVRRRGLLLRLHDFVCRPEHAAADGVQPAQGVHPAHG